MSTAPEDEPYTGHPDPHDSRTWGDWTPSPGEPFPFDGYVRDGTFVPTTTTTTTTGEATRGIRRLLTTVLGVALVVVLAVMLAR